MQESLPILNEREELLDRTYNANLVITVSPYLEFQESFQELQKKIVEYLPSLKFIPYDINLKKVKGISLFYPDNEIEVKDSVFSALFRPDNYFSTETRGDTQFGFDEWLINKKLDKSRIEEIKEGLLKKSLKVEAIRTVNKVWKFKAYNRIPGKSEVGGFMFGMDAIQVMDLSDKEHVTIISKEDEEPIISRYLIENNKIKIERFQDKLIFKIEVVTENEQN